MCQPAWKRRTAIVWFRNSLVAAAVALFLASGCWAQLPQAGDTTSPPTPGVGHDYIHSPVETVNPANGSVSIRIPLRIPSGRELTIPFSIAYDSNGAFYYGSNGGTPQLLSVTGVPFSQGGWSYGFPLLTFTEIDWDHPSSNGRDYPCTEDVNYVFQDPTGNRHNLGLLLDPLGPGGQTCGSHVLTGGEGPILASAASNDIEPPITLTDGNGTVYSFPAGNLPGGLPTSITDRNGNNLSISSTASSASVTDTAGRPAVSVGTFGGAPDSIDVDGLPSAYQVSWTTVSANYAISVVNLDPGFDANCPTSLSNSAKVISQIVLPNGQKYTFSYNSFGMLSEITYPSGGHVRYVWGLHNPNPLPEAGFWTDGTTSYSCLYDVPAVTDRYVSFDGTTEPLHQHFSYSTVWPNGSDEYTSKTTTVTTTDSVTGSSFSTVYTYSPVLAPNVPMAAGTGGRKTTVQIPVEQKIQYDGANGSPIKTVDKTWCNNNPRELCSETTTLNDTGQVAEVTYSYNSDEQQTERDEYDYGSAPHGPLLRKTVTNYASFTGAHIVDLPSSVITYDGSGNRVAETDSSYDQTGLQPTSVVQHNAVSGARGNLTTVTKDCFVGSTTCASGNATTTYSYYDTGQIYQMTDPKLNVTTFSYTDSYSSCGGNGPPAGATNAYLTQVTYPTTGGVAHTESHCYDYAAGLLKGTTDENGQTSTFTYADSLDRLTQANYPDGGQTLVSYNDTPPQPSVTTQKKLDTSSRFIVSVNTTNGMGLPIQTDLTSDPQGTDTTKTTYDGVGLARTVTNPYRSTSDPTYGVTTYTYDALGRTTLVQKPDGSTVSTSYSGNCTTVTDEAGKNRESCTDGLGRMTEVIENPGGLGYVTNYTYDTLDDLVSVGQGGSRNRSFSYDSLKRMTQSTNPEAGTVSYSYDANGNVSSKTTPAPNQTGSGTVTATYTYDALNRVTKTQYSDTTPTVFYNYDGATQTGCTAAITDSNPKGHRTGMCDAAGSEAWSHDSMGRTLTDQRTTNNVTKSVVYTYAPNLDGSINSITYPSGLAVTYAYDGAGRQVSASDQHSDTYASAATYAPQGALQTATLGATSGFAGFSLVSSYNDRLQPKEIKATNSGVTVMDYSYCFYALSSGTCPSTGTTNNGNVMGVLNNVDTTRSQTFSYDALNRIATAGTVNLSGTHCWDEQYGYDPWGNLLTIGAVSGYSGCSQPDNLNISATANNQISGYTYDAAGNLNTIPGTGGSSYAYNAEDEMTSSSAGVSYVYDGDGNRVEKSNGTLYWYGMGSEVLEKTSLTGSAPSDYIFFDGQRVGSRNPSATVIYLNDHLGSNRISASVATGGSTAPVQWDADYYPFGRIKTFTDTSGPTFRFTGKELDGETGLDNFGARYYSSNLGRFMIADWSSVPVPVPYANLTNPQTLNLYAMVSDNPETFNDLDGHTCGTIGSSDRNGCPTPSNTKTGKKGEGRTGDGLQKSNTQQAQEPTLEEEYARVKADDKPNSPDPLGDAIIGGIVGGVVTLVDAAGSAIADLVSSGSGDIARAAIPKPGSAVAEGAGKPFSQAVKDAAREESDSRCVFCGRETSSEPGPGQSNIDHSIPRSRGGDNSLANAQNTCRACNLAKGAKTTVEFLLRVTPPFFQ